GDRAGCEEAGGDPPPYPAAHARKGGVRADLGGCRAERCGTQSGGTGHPRHPRVRLLCALRGCEAQSEVVLPSPTMSASDGVGIAAVQVGSGTSSRLPVGSRKYSSRPVTKPWARYVSSSIFTPRSCNTRPASPHAP